MVGDANVGKIDMSRTRLADRHGSFINPAAGFEGFTTAVIVKSLGKVGQSVSFTAVLDRETVATERRKQSRILALMRRICVA